MTKLLTVRDICEILNIKQSTAYKWAEQGRIPYLDFGSENGRRCLRFDPDEIERLRKSKSRNANVCGCNPEATATDSSKETVSVEKGGNHEC